MNKPITLAITGASGSIYGIRLLEFLCTAGHEVDLIISETACKVIQLEMGIKLSFSAPSQNKEALIRHFGQNKSSQKKTSPKHTSPITISSDKHFQGLKLWSADNLAACVSSGSYRSQGMIVAPCSMGALGRMAQGSSDDLIARCADVCLKERYKLILLARETPLNAIHLQNMLTLTQAGAVILPTSPAFYHKPKSVDALVDFVIGKALDCFGVEHDLFTRWMS